MLVIKRVEVKNVLFVHVYGTHKYKKESKYKLVFEIEKNNSKTFFVQY